MIYHFTLESFELRCVKKTTKIMPRELLEKEVVLKKNYQKLLQDAIIRQDIEKVRIICEFTRSKGYSLNFQIESGLSPLILAIDFNTDIVDLLLDYGADPLCQYKGVDAVNYATFLGRLDVIKVLKCHDVNFNFNFADRVNPLFTSLRNKHFDLFNRFLNDGVEFSKEGEPKLNILFHYVQFGDFEVVKHIVSNDKMKSYLTDIDKNMALRLSVTQNKYAIFAYLLHAGVTITEADIIGQNQVIHDLYNLFSNDDCLLAIDDLKTKSPEYFDLLFNELLTQLADSAKTTLDLEIIISDFREVLAIVIEEYNAELGALLLQTLEHSERTVLGDLSVSSPPSLKRGVSNLSAGEENFDPQSPNGQTATDFEEDPKTKRPRALSFDGSADEESLEFLIPYDELVKDEHWLNLIAQEQGNDKPGIEI